MLKFDLKELLEPYIAQIHTRDFLPSLYSSFQDFFFFNNLTSCIIQVLFYIFSRSWRAPKTKQRDASNECSASELNEFTGLHETPKPHWPVYYTCYQKSYYLFVLPYRKFVVKGLFSLPIMTGLQLPALYYLDMERNETTFTLHVLS